MKRRLPRDGSHAESGVPPELGLDVSRGLPESVILSASASAHCTLNVEHFGSSGLRGSARRLRAEAGSRKTLLRAAGAGRACKRGRATRACARLRGERFPVHRRCAHRRGGVQQAALPVREHRAQAAQRLGRNARRELRNVPLQIRADEVPASAQALRIRFGEQALGEPAARTKRGRRERERGIVGEIETARGRERRVARIGEQRGGTLQQRRDLRFRCGLSLELPRGDEVVEFPAHSKRPARLPSRSTKSSAAA